MFIATGIIGAGLPYIIASAADFQLTAPLASSATFTIGLGAAAADRIVVACGWSGNALGSSNGITNITFNGVNATLAVAAGPTTAANANRYSSAIYYMAYPTTTSVSVEVFSNANTNQFFGCHVFSIYRARNAAPTAVAGTGTGANVVAALSVSAAMTAGGLYIIGGSSSGGTQTPNYANADTDSNSAAFNGFHGWDIKQPAGTPTFTRTPGSGLVLGTMCALTWR